MKDWTEFHIAITYFAGLFIAIISGILVLLYLRPVRFTIRKIVGKFDSLWTSSFKTTILLAGLLGAMSITFRSCDGEYDRLLNSKTETITKGLEQVSASFDYLTVVLGLWLIIFLIFRLTGNKSKATGT